MWSLPCRQPSLILGQNVNGFLHISDVCFDAVLTPDRMEQLGLNPRQSHVEEDDPALEASERPKTKKRRPSSRRRKNNSESSKVQSDNQSQDSPVVEDDENKALLTDGEGDGAKKKTVKRVRKVRKRSSKPSTQGNSSKESTSEEAAETPGSSEEEGKTSKKKIVRRVRKVKKKKTVAVKENADAKEKNKAEERPKKKTMRKKKEERRHRSSNSSPRQKLSIQEVLKPGQMILVQVAREAIDQKGATLSTFISMAGRVLVLMPNQTRIGISRKIQDRPERSKIKETLKQIDLPKNMGCIVRTSGVGKTAKEFNRDIKVLTQRYEKIKKMAESRKNPCLLYEEANLAIRALRDVYTEDIKAILIDDEAEEKALKGWLRSMIPGAAKSLKLHKESRPLFSKFNVEAEFEKLFSSRVELDGGASLVIEQTEAFVSIDINTAKMKDKDQHQAIFNTNKAAALEIPRQLRLRDLGGLIICDFIDMVISDHKKEIESVFSKALSKDRTRVKSSRISQFGIIEVSRQRMRQSVERATYESCPVCQGSGKVKNMESMSLKILREVRRGIGQKNINTIQISAHKSVVEHILNEKKKKILDLEEKFDKMVRLHGGNHVERDSFDIKYLGVDGNAVKVN